MQALGVETEDDIHQLASYFVSQTKSTDTEYEGSDGHQESSRSQKSEAPILVHPNEVVRILRQFVEDHKQPPGYEDCICNIINIPKYYGACIYVILLKYLVFGSFIISRTYFV